MKEYQVKFNNLDIDKDCSKAKIGKIIAVDVSEYSGIRVFGWGDQIPSHIEVDEHRIGLTKNSNRESLYSGWAVAFGELQWMRVAKGVVLR